MEPFNEHNTVIHQQQKPEMLYRLCIASFIMCGISILMYGILSLVNVLDEAMINQLWPQFTKTYPILNEEDPILFFHNMGQVGIYTFLANIGSLIGVLLMWRLKKTGFHIYTISELSVNVLPFLFPLIPNTGSGNIFTILMDAFIIISYGTQLKHMK